MRKKQVGFKESRKSQRSYFKWRMGRATPAVNRVEKYADIKGAKVLDLGCGYGSLSAVVESKGASVTGVEVDENKLNEARRFLKDKSNIKLIKVKDELLPFNDEFFDIIFIFDVIEHISNPQVTIDECYRVLKNHGIIYVEFTPYYSITGHHLYDFAKWPIHILSEERIKKIVYAKKISGFMDTDYFWKQFKSLNKMRIKTFQNMSKKYKRLEERFIVKYPGLFEVNLPFLNYLGTFKDLFSMSFEGIYRKEESLAT
jgi:ubiquinone/menaquinone biosynthesis C-methylase UbiE